ncbi:low molecular weight phosphatase family protein [Mycolicibacterium aichiense]|uniref:arsenate reductase/protein-tyrosine-phosphatase family protein n=1 Tax=Mycolicibacterium aichiense TaxID=1799 RepID=UPI003D670D10
MHVLFVCTGNICRSPTAERLAAAYAAESRLSDFTTASAGTRAVINHPIHPDAAVVLEGLGGDSSDFAARQLNYKIASAADLVLTMTRAHRDAVVELTPRKLNKTFTLTEIAQIAAELCPQDVKDLPALRGHLAANESLDIADPIGQSLEVFSQVGTRIAQLLPPVLELCRRSLA